MRGVCRGRQPAQVPSATSGRSVRCCRTPSPAVRGGAHGRAVPLSLQPRTWRFGWTARRYDLGANGCVTVPAGRTRPTAGRGRSRRPRGPDGHGAERRRPARWTHDTGSTWGPARCCPSRPTLPGPDSARGRRTGISGRSRTAPAFAGRLTSLPPSVCEKAATGRSGDRLLRVADATRRCPRTSRASPRPSWRLWCPARRSAARHRATGPAVNRRSTKRG